MNKVLQTIMGRRSIRKYKEDQISDSDLKTMLEAAINAPSARNQQKWHFTVIQNREKLDSLSVKIKENIKNSDNEFLKGRVNDPAFSIFHGAPTVVMISGEDNTGFVEVDCGLAAENICLAASSLNIGSCVVASSEMLFECDEKEKIKQELGIPAGYSHIVSVTLGYQNYETPAAKPRSWDVINYIK